MVSSGALVAETSGKDDCCCCCFFSISVLGLATEIDKGTFVPSSPYNGISDTWSVKPTKVQDSQQRRVAENHSTISSHLACWLQFRGKRGDYKEKERSVWWLLLLSTAVRRSCVVKMIQRFYKMLLFELVPDQITKLHGAKVSSKWRHNFLD